MQLFKLLKTVLNYTKKPLLKSEFFNRDSCTVARELLGQQLVRRTQSGVLRMQIREVEVYDGFDDLASHARFGETQRNAPMFGPPGHWYLYLIYGMYWMINITTREAGYPAALLIRGAGDYDGPGKLSRALSVNGDFSGKPAHIDIGFWIEPSAGENLAAVMQTPRIGVEYAKEWKDAPLRFLLT